MTHGSRPSRRELLALTAGLAGAAALPGCATTYAWQRPPANPASALPVAAGYRPRVTSTWLARGDEASGYPRFVRLCEAATDFSWLSRGDRVFVKRVGNAVVLVPYQEPWQSLFDSLDRFSDDYMQDREQPAQQVRELPFE